MSRFFYMPPCVVTGPGALKLAGQQLLRGKKALIVTGKIVEQQPGMQALKGFLEGHGVAFAVFSDTLGEPTDGMARAAAEAFTREGCDYLIAMGGGSPMDLMKAAAVLLRYPGTPLRRFLGQVIEGPFVPMVAIPTTAGTGSEATMFTVITDEETQVKMLLKGPALIPDVAVVDPSFTYTAPPAVTAATGLDALCHAIEAYTSRLAQPLTDPLALSATRRILTYLPRAYRDGGDEEARHQMALAALEAGVCITNSSVTLIHGLSRPIGALFHVSHGLSNAMLLPACLKFALDGAMSRFADLARMAGVCQSAGDKEAAGDLLAAVEALCRVCEIPTPAKYGLDKATFYFAMDKMADDALASGSPGNTRKPVTRADCLAIYQSLWD